VDFTREPIIETVITPKEGHKIVVRSSKNPGSEEYFVDAVEVVTFGNSSFFRSLERPKAFLVPVSDYEILEVREARIVLKNVGLDRSIKIAGGKENVQKPKEVKEEKVQETQAQQQERERSSDPKENRRRDRRRQGRRRNVREDENPNEPKADEDKVVLTPPSPEGQLSAETAPVAQSILNSLLTPPPTLISETLKSYKENALFKEAFYTKEELQQVSPMEVVEALEPESSIDDAQRIFHEQQADVSPESTPDSEKL
jgi:hypothetical protein